MTTQMENNFLLIQVSSTAKKCANVEHPGVLNSKAIIFATNQRRLVRPTLSVPTRTQQNHSQNPLFLEPTHIIIAIVHAEHIVTRLAKGHASSVRTNFKVGSHMNTGEFSFCVEAFESLRSLHSFFLFFFFNIDTSFSNAATASCTFAPCSSGTLTDKCSCGTDNNGDSITCDPSSTPGVYCDSTASKCKVDCPQTDGVTPIVMPHDNSKSSYSNRCSCGTKLCYWNVRDNVGQHYCELATDTCSPIPMCSNKDGTVKLEPGSSGLGACQCGAERCILDKNSNYVDHGPYKFKIDQFCNIGIESSPVSQATASCTLAPCANTDGTVGNPEQCQCGRDKCQRESLDARGNTIAHPGPYFCNSAKHICGITKDAMKYSITALKPNSSPPEFTQCHDTPSNVVIMDETECFQASADLGI